MAKLPLAHLNCAFRPGSKRDVGREEAHAWPGGKRVPFTIEPTSTSPSSSDEAKAQEWEEAFRFALAKLPNDICQMIQLRILDGLSFADIGRELGVAADTARKRFDRAMSEFARQFAAEHLHEP